MINDFPYYVKIFFSFCLCNIIMSPLMCKMKMSPLSYYNRRHQDSGRCFFERSSDIYDARYKKVEHNGGFAHGKDQ
jgi:hypothetical protein